MVLPVPIRAPLSKDDKTALLRAAYQSLRESNAIDERESEPDPDSLHQWYDDTIPLVTDIKQLAGHMDIELSRRRGELIAQEGERRGGNQSKVSQRETLTGAEKHQRDRDRVIAAEPEAVMAYQQEELAAQRVPSKRGAVRAARTARAAKPKVTKAKAKVAKVKTKAEVVAALSFGSEVRAEVRARIEPVLGQALTLDELAKHWKVHTDIARRYVREAALLASVTKDDNRFTIKLTPEQTELEAALAAHEQFLEDLHKEIKLRRKEARDGYNEWKPDNINSRQQSRLLDRVEDALKIRAIPALYTPAMSQEKDH
jgi:hypothetical protein